MTDTSAGLRIAILTHSVNPRGGVVHALELADALTRFGHTPVVHAPDPAGRGFLHTTNAPTIGIPASPASRTITAMVETRIDEYVDYFASPVHRRFDVFHAQDGISGNALATLRQRGQIHGFARTVHHMDNFTDPQLQTLQRRSIEQADQLLVVSHMWADRIATEFGRNATVVGNGVNMQRYSPRPSATDDVVRQRLHLRRGPVLLCVGGVEERKNTIRILEAFRQVHAIHPDAQLVIAGGASVLDHSAYHRQFHAALAASGLPDSAVILTGVVEDADMPSLYRLSDALVFASVREGFGLAVLEAMASGLPVIASHIPPFTEYLTGGDVVWCDPLNPGSIANAVASAFAEPLQSRLMANGHQLAARHDWLRAARAHLPVYTSMRAMHDA